MISMIKLGIVLSFIVCYIILISIVYRFLYDNGFESKHRKFQVLCKSNRYIVQWKLFLFWHNYIVDPHYMDYAEFETEQEANDFISKLNI